LILKLIIEVYLTSLGYFLWSALSFFLSVKFSPKCLQVLAVDQAQLAAPSITEIQASLLYFHSVQLSAQSYLLGILCLNYLNCWTESKPTLVLIWLLSNSLAFSNWGIDKSRQSGSLVSCKPRYLYKLVS